MNYIPEVAKILGVETGEEFDILNNETEMLVHGPYKFTDNALVDYVGCKTKSLLYGLLTGDYTIQKRPWRPKDGRNIGLLLLMGMWDGAASEKATQIALHLCTWETASRPKKQPWQQCPKCWRNSRKLRRGCGR